MDSFQPARRPRLLFFVTEDFYFCSHRLELARAALAAGYEVSVATRVREHGHVIREAGLILHPFENARTGLNPLKEVRTLLRLILLYRRVRPDIVHHVALKPVLYGSVAARFGGKPRIVNALAGMGWLFMPGSARGRWLRPWVRVALKRLLDHGIVLVQNPDDARLLARLGGARLDVRLIRGAGVDLRHFHPRPEPGGIVTVVLPARLLWAKGVGDFVEASRLLRSRGLTARFLLAGEPDRANPSAVPVEQIEKWVTEGLVTYLGWVDDMAKVLAGSHIVCLPSYYGEGIPKSLIEAAAAGRPIVTTDMPGCREIVHDGDNGLLVPPRNPERLAAALGRLIEDPVLRGRMGGRGRMRAEQEFGLARVIEQSLALYSDSRR